MNNKIKFAIPTINDRITAHFGHCRMFAIVEVENNKVIRHGYISPPGHQPGAYPRFLAEHGVNVIIAGGMGSRAQALFSENNIEVHIGVSDGTPVELVNQFLNDQLNTGENFCDH